MVKSGGGTKRKLPMEKISQKESLRTSFTKRTYGLHSKASQLCLLSGAQIAVISTPPSSHSNVSFYSFGHSSVEAIVSAFLTRQRLVPVREGNTSREDVGIALARKDIGLGFWWNDEFLTRSENPDEIEEAIESMSILLKKLRSINDNETLTLQSTSEDDVVVSSDVSEEQAEIFPICEGVCVTDKNNNSSVSTGSFDVCDQEIDIDQFIDFEMPFDTSAFDDILLETNGKCFDES
ncbi:unnamed protein product [Microthlaspi erraticum]|uniref:MADS-box domain-containing protein n=1 Tax=Microthlaspi erraticum TaxID=1685480 RepID=A0A6D2JUA6_9BRAS|nr:unnamed protein product [Microthlaspi erraticum]